MGDTFGAGMDPVVDSVRGYPDSYLRRTPFEGAATPTPSGDGSSGLNIKQINAQIMNQHPEMLTALSGQWARLHDWLEGQRSRLHKESKALHRTWSAPAAVEFLRRGPGRTLAYLDDWIRAADANIRALQSLAGIITKARGDMKDLWTEYSNAMTDIRTMQWWERPHENPWTSPVALQLQLVQRREHEYNLKAQQLASRVANDIHMANLKLAEGHGMPFHPHNAVLNLPGHPPLLGGGGVPTVGMRPGPQRRPGPTPALPKTPPVGKPPDGAPGGGAALPPLPALPPAAGLPPGLAPRLPEVPAAQLPAVPPMPPVPAVGPGAVPAVPVAGAVPGGVPGSGVVPAVALPRPTTSPSLPGLTLRAATTASSVPPGAALPPPAGRTLGGSGMPAGPGQRGRDPLGAAGLPTPSTGVSQPFAPPTSGAVAPVLGTQPKRRATVPLNNDAQGVVAGPTVPTVFAGPVANRAAAGARPTSRRREAAGQEATNWLDVSAATAEAASPVLGAGRPAQPAAIAAAAAAVIAAAQSERSADVRFARTEPPEPELAVRRMGDADEATTRDWSVSSPGGGVVGREAQAGYREEPKPTLAQN